MRVIAPAVTRVSADVRRVRALNLELLGMFAATLIVTFGITLTYLAKAGSDPGGKTIPLRALGSAADLEPVLGMYPSVHERQAVARALYRHAAGNPGLEHVGSLAAVTLPAEEVRSDPGLPRLRERLASRSNALAVPVLSSADLASVKPQLTVRTAGEFRARTIRAVAILLAVFWLAHLFRRWRRRDDDPVLLPAVVLLCGVGMMAMLGLRDPLRDTMAVVTFAGGVAAGMAALLLASEIDFESSRLRRAVILPLGAALALALLLLLFGSGPGSSGVKVNLFGAQPVEVIRLLVVFALAAYFGRRIELLRALSEPATPTRRWLRFFRMPRWKDVRPVLGSMALVLVFFFFQKDLGPALVLTCVFLAMYGIGRGHGAFVIAGFALLVIGFAAAYWIGEPATVRQRVTIWADPWNNGVPGGNQIAHGFWALATGGAWGSGPGLGNPELVPAGHTDFVLAAVGEELGFAGLAAVLLLYAVLAWRCLRTALRAPGDYSAFLAVGVALGLVVQALVIASGLLGLVPLSGVVTPFLSFGRSSMLANCFAVGIVLAAAQRRGPQRAHLRRSVNALGGVLAAAALVVAARAAWVQVVRADEFAAAASISEQADGGYRFEHNPRLLLAARTLVRGTIYDRNGLPLATSRADEIAAIGTIYKAAGMAPVEQCADPADRCYPLAGLAFHVLGDWNHQTNWGAGNSSYIERDSDAQLKGYGDRARTIDVVNPRTGKRQAAISRDYRELLPLVRQRYWLKSAAIDGLRARNRDLHTTIDARLQLRASQILKQRIEAGGDAHGAAVVLDAGSGEVLASVSYPWPGAADLRSGAAPTGDGRDIPDHWFDRTRYGLYPPGSVFKLVVAGAALRAQAERGTFSCVRLPDGRVGHAIRGSARPVRDDPKDTVPHGSIDLHDGLVVSCNAYFAQLAQALGPGAVLDAASVFQIDVSRTSTAAGLLPTLPHAGYGQGQVVTSPLKMARVSASIAAGGLVAPVRWFVPEARSTPHGARSTERFLSTSQAVRLGRAMRDVITQGTGRALRGNAVPIAGKTGTAEVGEGAAHSWFTGFAPYGGGGRRIAFAVLVENAGYGARAAAPVAGDLVTAARELELIK
ncbi:MAG TPA: FtsW/RodA/SpoVE family cell cycle protein [Vicinamibacterales bacterium]|nr:FtsW/RodA/SpoVE family cell cycle protein [Vicinamibacterales bacterium]